MEQTMSWFSQYEPDLEIKRDVLPSLVFVGIFACIPGIKLDTKHLSSL